MILVLQINWVLTHNIITLFQYILDLLLFLRYIYISQNFILQGYFILTTTNQISRQNPSATLNISRQQLPPLKEETKFDNNLEDDINNINDLIYQSKKKIVEKKYQEAIEILFISLKEFLGHHGENHIELMVGYLVLAEANICINSLKKAEHFIISASGSLIKFEDELSKMASSKEANERKREIKMCKANLAKIIGKLKFGRGKNDEAIDQISQCIYLESRKYGPESYKLTPNYYQMGLIFHKKDNIEAATTFYSKVVQIWKKVITNTFTQEDHSQIEEIFLDEAFDILKNILMFLENEFGEMNHLVGECHLTIALYLMLGNNVIARESLKKAYQIYSNSLGEYDERTQELAQYINLNEEKINQMQIKYTGSSKQNN